MTWLTYIAAAFFEIAGCFAFWSWWRHDKPALWLVPGVAFAAYGGIYIAASLVWLWLVEDMRPDRFDLIGGALCILGALVIILGPRAA